MENVTIPSPALARLVAAVASLNGVKFVGVTYRSKESGELARHTLIVGASYTNTVRESIDLLTARPHIGPDMQETKALADAVKALPTGSKERKAANARLAEFQNSIGAERAAAAELCLSLFATLDAGTRGEQNPGYTKAGLYDTICEGIKVSRVDGSFELCGLSHSKKVIEPGVYPVVNSSAKTLAKKALEKTLPIGRYCTLAVDAGHMESVRIAGQAIDCE